MDSKFLLASLALSFVALAGCSSSSDAEFGIHNNAFDPSSLTVKSGTEVHFQNHDSIPHAIVANAGASVFATGSIAGGADGHITAPGPGTYPFYCSIHPSMKATLIVN